MARVDACSAKNFPYNKQSDYSASRDEAIFHCWFIQLRQQRLLSVLDDTLRVCPNRQLVQRARELVASALDFPLDPLSVPSHLSSILVRLPRRPSSPRIRFRQSTAVVARRSSTVEEQAPSEYRWDSVAGVTENNRLAVGDTAPAFTLPDADGNDVSLSDYRGRKVIVYFYPAASTPGCTKQACDFRDSLAELDGSGIDVVGISPDKPAKLAKFRDAEQLTFPLLSDPEKSTLTAWGAFGEKKLYGKLLQGVIRSTFLVDENGIIELAQYNVRATGHVAKLRRDLSV